MRSPPFALAGCATFGTVVASCSLQRTSSTPTPTTAAVASAVLPRSFCGELSALANSARSIMSPATRATANPVGLASARRPIPAAISRTPTARITVLLRLLSLTPIRRFIRRGATICATPRPMLNQPRPCARLSARRAFARLTSRSRPSPVTLPPPPNLRTGLSVPRSEEHTSELQSLAYLVCRLLLEKKKTDHRKELDATTDQHGHRELPPDAHLRLET